MEDATPALTAFGARATRVAEPDFRGFGVLRFVAI
jgi:hypothetical protein